MMVICLFRAIDRLSWDSSIVFEHFIDICICKVEGMLKKCSKFSQNVVKTVHECEVNAQSEATLVEQIRLLALCSSL